MKCRYKNQQRFIVSMLMLARNLVDFEPSGPLQSQLDLALNPAWGNTADNVVTIRVPPGTLIYEGVAAPQPISGGSSYLGGGNQVIIPKVRGGWELP